jgi:hypothetical protein
MYLLSNRPSWSVAHSAVNSLNINLNLIGIWEFIQAKSLTVAQCVTNHLRRGQVYQSTVEKFMLKKLMQKPSDKLNLTLQYYRTVANSDVNSLETCLKTDEICIASNCVMIFFLCLSQWSLIILPKDTVQYWIFSPMFRMCFAICVQ